MVRTSINQNNANNNTNNNSVTSTIKESVSAVNGKCAKPSVNGTSNGSNKSLQIVSSSSYINGNQHHKEVRRIDSKNLHKACIYSLMIIILWFFTENAVLLKSINGPCLSLVRVSMYLSILCNWNPCHNRSCAGHHMGIMSARF